MLGHLLLPEIQEMVRAGDFAGLRDALSDFIPPDLAELLNELPPEDQAVIFRILPRELAAETFGYLEHDSQEVLIRALGDEKAAQLLEAMAPDDRTALLEEMPAEVIWRLLELLSPKERLVAQQLLGYPEGSVGRRMTPDYVAIRAHWTVDQVLDHVRLNGRDSETLNVLYVTDDQGHLEASIRVRELLLSPRDRLIKDMMGAEVVALKVTDDQEHAVQAFRKYDLVALPVTDTRGILVGIVTVDDMLDVVEQEATEDIQKLAGMQALEEPYDQIGYLGMVKKRAPWLVLLFIAEVGATAAMARYDDQIAKVTALSFLVPLIMSCGGNSGSQAGTLVIRAMALKEIELKDWLKVCRRELLTGLSFGLTLGIIGYLVVCTWSFFDHGAKFTNSWNRMAIVLGLSVLGVVMWGTIVGSMLPFLLKRLRLDPATSSAPFVATLIDITGLIIYFNIAMLMLRGVLL